MTYWTNNIATLYYSDAREMPIESGSIHCVVTSPPYYGLRVYRSDSDAMIGLEETPERYIASMLEVMAEVGRVLRDDGVLWVNLGDSYGGSWGNYGARNGEQRQRKEERYARPAYEEHTLRPGNSYQRSGQLLGIPWRFALAMQDAGWILRSDVIWAKKSAMPESLNGTRWERCRVKTKAMELDNPRYRHGKDGTSRPCNEPTGTEWADCPGCPKCEVNDGYVLRNGSWRCTSSHEYIFQFVKSMGYYSDGEAVKVQSQGERIGVTLGGNKGVAYTPTKDDPNFRNGSEQWGRVISTGSTANRRDVWRDIKPEPYGGEHYATFPSDLPRLCIQASTSEAGVCRECGSQWARVVEREPNPSKAYNVGEDMTGGAAKTGNPQTSAGLHRNGGNAEGPPTKTLGWRPTCTCNADKVPARVLDPFAGTGTTLLAAQRLGRESYGVDLSIDYLEQAKKRLSGETLPLMM